MIVGFELSEDGRKVASALLYFIGGAVVVGAGMPVHAGESVEGARYLDELVVTGTRSARTVSDTPVRTEVVTQRELERTHARDVAEALENVPGLLLREIHGKAGREVWLQGIDADRVLVLIDGLPMTATTGSAVDVSQLAILDIERIEIVKGAVSAQYGSAAMGGVINVITRDVAPGVRGELAIDGGSYGEQNPSGDEWSPGRYNLRAGVNLGGESLRLRVSGSSQHSDGIDPQPDSWQRPGDEFDRHQFNSRLAWVPAEGHEVYGEVGFYEEESESRYTVATPGPFPNQGKTESVERLRFAVGGDHRPSASAGWFWSLLHEGLADDTEKFNANARFDARKADQQLRQGSLHTELNLNDAHQLMLGADYRYENLEQSVDGETELMGNQARVSRTSRELWVQDSWMPSERWEWVLGFRAQDDSDFGDHYAPKISGRYDLAATGWAQHYIRASWGTGYRVPNLKERYFEFDHSQLGYVVEGQPDLEPESSSNVQLGWGVSFGNVGWLEVSAFLNNIDDLIQTELDAAVTAARPDGVQVFSYSNISKARTRGVETTMGWALASGWEATAGYTYTEAEDRTTGQDLSRRPAHQVQLGLDGPGGISGLSWTARFRAQSSETVDAASGITSPGYGTVDLSLNQRLGEDLRVFAGVDNLANRQRDFDRAGEDFGPVAGRYVYAGITLGFGL
ncbi:TonB-dependent receptor plug domain-containing protein [Marinobacter zhejiangensis]|uniref:Outer membrane receptor for ferrienterochelin and colicins n=1 Tax=Marinobacter zhejiangensis TaxID=488535 RepID=A0A1I4TN51_9GAMM|nr:TonB-dependent receptor [Marinobacter zhejiangensis]SFM78212.1 outer membrane receptor for ferrienterochelin and colicins [Marinobacter zhejiangensis]